MGWVISTQIHWFIEQTVLNVERLHCNTSRKKIIIITISKKHEIILRWYSQPFASTQSHRNIRLTEWRAPDELRQMNAAHNSYSLWASSKSKSDLDHTATENGIVSFVSLKISTHENWCARSLVERLHVVYDIRDKGADTAQKESCIIKVSVITLNGKACLRTCYKTSTLLNSPFSWLTGNDTMHGATAWKERIKRWSFTLKRLMRNRVRSISSIVWNGTGEMSHMKLTIVYVLYQWYQCFRSHFTWITVQWKVLMRSNASTPV